MKWITSKERQKSRIKICEICPHFRSNTRTCGKPVIGNYVTNIQGEKIKLCGCFMDAKTNLSFSGCPLKKWEPSQKNIKELLEAESFITEMLESQRISRDNINKSYKIYKDLIGENKTPGSCPPCINQDLKKLRNKIIELKKETE